MLIGGALVDVPSMLIYNLAKKYILLNLLQYWFKVFCKLYLYRNESKKVQKNKRRTETGQTLANLSVCHLLVFISTQNRVNVLKV